MAYHVRLKSPAEREETIRAAVKASKDTREFYDFRSTKTQLSQIHVAEHILVYRMESFRTYVEQHEYAIREKKPLDFFVISQENENVQQLQHEILTKLLAKQRSTDSVAPMIDVLRREKQQEPLLITHRGVVVNGNRRLAGMRELFSEDGVTYGDFNYIYCLVLPENATTAEIVDIEAALQAKSETREDYDWVGDCLLIQRLIDLSKNVDQVAHRLNRKKSEIRNSLNALTEANLYLKDWANSDGEYSRVLDGEQLFKGLPDGLQGKDPGLQEASRVMAWNLFENRAKLGERLYAFNLTFGKQAANVLNRVAADLGVSMEVDTNMGGDSFEVELDSGAGSVSYQPLIDAFRDSERKDEAVETLIDVCRSVLESEREKKSGRTALKAITAANARLTEADLIRADPSTYGAIGKQLEQITKRVQVLQKTISELKKSPAGKGEAGSADGE